jgi:phage tail sheath protein FI
MSTFTYPGVYIQELSSGVHTITGVATSIAVFVGWAPQGSVTQATLVESWPEYEAAFGGFDSRSYLGYAVYQFFANGGQQAYIVRLVWDGSLPAPAPGTNPTLCATAVAAGVGYATTQITAASGSIVSLPAMLNVGTPALQSIVITPANLPPIPINASGLRFHATGMNSDPTTPDLTSSANWSSSDKTVITMAGGGVPTIVGPGTAIITATDPTGLISGSLAVTVSAASLTAVAVTPNSVALAAGQTQQFAATGNYSDGTTQDLTSVAAWTPPTDFATTPGLFKGPAAPNVAAAWAGVTSPNVGVTVGVAVPVSLLITLVAPTLQVGQTAVFTATVVNSDGTSASVSATATWNSSNHAVATFAANTVTAAGVGVATITAASGSLSASTTLTVTAATLQSITVTPAAPSIAKGQWRQLKALGIYSDGSTADLTGCANWAATGPEAGDVSVSSEGVAIVNGVGTFTSGLVTGVNPTAPATPVPVGATWQTITGTAQIMVTAAALKSIAITPASATILSGQTQQFVATGTLSDGTTSVVTSTATWKSSAPSAATINPTGLANAVAAGGSLTLFANNPGSWGNSLLVSVTVQPPPNNARFSLLVQRVNPRGTPQTLESFVNLSLTPTDPQYAVTVVDNDSSYISFINPATGLPVVPAAAPSPTAAPVALSGGADGAVLTPASDGNFELVLLNQPLGVYLLDRVDIFNLLCIPAETDAPTISILQGYCAKKRAFYIVDAPKLSTYALLNASGPAGSNPGSITGTHSNNSAYYFPWILAPDPLFGNRPTLFPPCGFVAGIYAATDANSPPDGVWKAPAGINASLTGSSGLQYVLTDQENGDLNIQAINCLRQFKVYGDVVWGARTLQGNDQAGSEWKYIPIRRLALFIESSLYDGTQWVVFEPNDEKLWSQIRLNIGAFMQGLFLKGGFQGTSPQQAYFVKCDSENNPPASISLGIVNILVGFAPLYPAEFVVIQIVQIAGQSS